MTTNETASSVVAGDLLETEAAYAAILPEMNGLTEQELEPMNIDVVSAVTTVLGCIPELQALRPEIARHLPLFDLDRFDNLKQYALALNHAHALHRGIAAPSVSFAELGNELTEIRDRLYADAASLASHGFFDASRLEQCKRTVGYRPLATDVFTLVALFKEHWGSIQGRTPVTWPLLQDAGRRATELLEAVGLREQAPAALVDTAVTRHKAFTLFIRAYDDARRAAAYLRAARGDAEAIAPSLYQGRGGRGKSESAPQATELASAKTSSNESPRSGEPVRAITFSNPLGFPVGPPLTS